MTEDKITFSAQQEPQSELESDDDDDNEEPEPMPSMKAVVQCIEVTLKWAELYDNSTRLDVTHFSYNSVIYDGPHIPCYSEAPLYSGEKKNQKDNFFGYYLSVY